MIRKELNWGETHYWWWLVCSENCPRVRHGLSIPRLEQSFREDFLLPARSGNVSVHPQTWTQTSLCTPRQKCSLLWALFTQTQFCPANAASRGGCRSPSKQSKNQHQELLNNMTTFILDSSQLSPCFLSSKPLAFQTGCLMLSGCLLPATSNRFLLTFADWLFYSFIPSIMRKTATTAWAPKFFSWSKSKSTSLFRLFFPQFYSTKHTAVRKSPLTLVTCTNSSI